jgi:quercetin dioxygenase-like cupin family protein
LGIFRAAAEDSAAKKLVRQKPGGKATLSDGSTKDRMIAPGETLALSSLVTPTCHGMASRIVAKTLGGNVTLFAFDAGEALTEHSSSFEALAIVIEGACTFTVGGAEARAAAGTAVRLPAGVPHAVEANQTSRLLLIMLRTTESRTG